MLRHVRHQQLLVPAEVRARDLAAEARALPAARHPKESGSCELAAQTEHRPTSGIADQARSRRRVRPTSYTPMCQPTLGDVRRVERYPRATANQPGHDAACDRSRTASAGGASHSRSTSCGVLADAREAVAAADRRLEPVALVGSASRTRGSRPRSGSLRRPAARRARARSGSSTTSRRSRTGAAGTPFAEQRFDHLGSRRARPSTGYDGRVERVEILHAQPARREARVVGERRPTDDPGERAPLTVGDANDRDVAVPRWGRRCRAPRRGHRADSRSASAARPPCRGPSPGSRAATAARRRTSRPRRMSRGLCARGATGR